MATLDLRDVLVQPYEKMALNELRENAALLRELKV